MPRSVSVRAGLVTAGALVAAMLPTSSAAASAGPYTSKNVIQTFGKQGMQLIPSPPDKLGNVPAHVYQQKPIVEQGGKISLHAVDFVVFVFPTTAIARSAHTRSLIQSYARHSCCPDSSETRENVTVVWQVTGKNSADIARIKRALNTL